MPNRNRVIYQSEALAVGPTSATGQHFKQFAAESIYSGANLLTGLYRIQNCNYSFNISRTPVNQFGELAAIDRVILDTPTVNLSFGYLLANAWNERALGLVVDGTLPALSGILNRVQDDKNYFLKITPEGSDAVGNSVNTVDTAVVGFGNGYLTSYSTKAAINSFPMVDIGVTALNMTFATGTSGTLPAITPADGTRITQYNYDFPTVVSSPGTGLLDVSALRPGDILIDLRQRDADDEANLSNATAVYSTAGVNISNAKIQSYNLSFSLGREPLQKLGSKFAFSREITFPIDVSLSLDAIVGDLTTGTLSDFINCDQSYDITISLKQPVCPGNAQPVMMRYALRNARLNSQSFSSSIGSNKTVSLEFASQIGGPSQSTVGLFMSGVVAVQ